MHNEERTQESPIEAARKSPPARLAYRPAEAAQACGLSETYIRAQLREGKIKAKKSNTNTLILAAALNEWLESLPDWEPAAGQS